MELWVRSQDKKQLSKVNDGLFIANGFTNTDDSFIGIKNVGHVGRYKTEERALEVLNEIQSIIRGKFATSIDIKLSLKSFEPKEIQNLLEQMAVYEMPEK